MRRSTLLLIAGFALGFGLGFFVWQKQVGNQLREENARLRDQVKNAEALRAENAKLTSERIDPAELNRLRDGQTELLRLRGQVSQLRQQVNVAQAGAPRAQAVAPTSPPTTDESAHSPVETYTAKATATVGWRQIVATGGWKLPSGNRGVVLLQPMADDSNPGTVLVRAQILEIPESLMTGLDALKAGDKESTGYSVLAPEQARTLMAGVKQTEGASVVATPSVTTASGGQAQISVTEQFTGPNGESLSTGPVLDVTPTIAADGQSVQLNFDARYSKRKPGK